MKQLLLFFAVGLTTVFFTSCAPETTDPAIPKDAAIEKAVSGQLSKMSLDEKIGQMVQLEINQVTLTQSVSETQGFQLDPEKLRKAFEEHKLGSLLNMLGGVHGADVPTWQRAMTEIRESSEKYLGIPCLYGLDQVHGTTYSLGGTLFPQPIGMSATFNPSLVKRVGEICAYETRACGVPWVFVPDLDLGRNPAWSRQYEGVGEDPYLGATIGVAYLLGFQGDDPNHIDAYHVGTCLKHYTGYGITANGRDRVPGVTTDMELREKYFAPFLAAFRAGALSAMTNSSVLNGMNGVANKKLLTGWLKEELNWDGMIVTDWADIENLLTRDHIAADRKAGIVLAINAGVDMMMVPSRWDYGALLKEAVESGDVKMDRIDDAVSRILRLKHRLGLYGNPAVNPDLYPKFGSEEHAAVAKQVALESEVLLKNDDNVLPIAKGKKLLVCGPNANSMRALNGGWSYTWQGSGSEPFTSAYHTIYEALRDKFGAANVMYVPGVEYNNMPNQFELEQEPDYVSAVRAAQGVDYVIACVGENSYAETPGNLGNLHLSAQQGELVRRLAATGKPVVLVLNQGRCRLIYDIEPLAKAVVDVMLPGNYGGDALADLLAGDENFSGKLPMTYPSQPHAFTTYDYKVSEVRETMEGVYNYEAQTAAQWWFGAGLSYTTFAYDNLRSSKDTFTEGDVLEVMVDVTNTGNRAGKEVVMLYSSDLVASLTPDNRRLRAFEKVELQPGETKTVTLTLKASDLAIVGDDGHWVLEKGDFRLAVGGERLNVTCTETHRWETPNI